MEALHLEVTLMLKKTLFINWRRSTIKEVNDLDLCLMTSTGTRTKQAETSPMVADAMWLKIIEFSLFPKTFGNITDFPVS